MEKTLYLTRHATIDISIHAGQFHKREVLTHPDKFTIKNLDYAPLLDFDVKDLTGKKIVSATLELMNINNQYPYAVDVTTVSQQWDPKYSTYYRCQKGKPWAHEGWMSDVMMGAGHSQYFREKVSFDEQTKIWSIPVHPAVITAMATDQSFGFALIDARSRAHITEKVEEYDMEFAACEKLGHVPKLTVVYEDAPAFSPVPVKGLSALPVEPSRTQFPSAVQLNWLTMEEYPEDMHFNIYCSDRTRDLKEMTLIEKFMTPILRGSCGAAYGTAYGTTIEGLKPDKDYVFAVEITNNIEKSEPQYINVRTLQEERKLSLPVMKPTPAQPSRDVFTAKDFTVGVTGDITKINPLNGSVIPFGGAEAPYNNGIYADGKLSVLCAKGEKYAFQLVVTTQKEQADFTVEADGAPEGMIRLHQAWCLQHEGAWYPEVAIPLTDSAFSIPFAENKIPGQKALSLLVDVMIAENTPAGLYSMTIRIQSGGETVSVPLTVEVADWTLKKSPFIMELNGYIYLPKCAGYEKDDDRCAEVERAYYRLAYEHDAVVNILPYSHIGTVQEGFAPEIGLVDGEMHVTDWTVWDAHYSQYLDGSYIEDTVGRKVPVSHMYLPFHENWPMSMEQYYKIVVPDMPYPENVSEHMRLCSTIDADFREGYREGIKSVMKDFIRHFDEKGWQHVEFQYFFNNKHFYKKKGMHDRFPFGDGLAKWLGLNTTGNNGEGTSWWLLDEPVYRSDWVALQYYASILREARAETNSGEYIKFRADISKFNNAFNFLDGLLDTVVGGGREDVNRKRMRVFDETYWPYGSWNGVEDDNMHSVMWILDIYLKGSRGIIPWYNFALDLNYEVPDSCAAVYPGKRFGRDEAFASMRLKAGRKALELIKYMEAFKNAFGYSDRQLKQYVQSFIELKGRKVTTSVIDAGTNVYEDTRNMLEEMRLDMLNKLMIRARM